MFVKTVELLERARRGGYAIGGFNVWNLESALALLKAAEETSSPVIFNIQEKILKLLPLGVLEGLIHILGRDSKILMALHLDHGKTFELCAQCIQLGYQSVMVDGGDLPLEENVTLTKRVVEYAHTQGVSVEGQVGEVGLSWMKEKGGRKTDPMEAKEFVKATGVDLLAISIGTESGPYEKEPHLDYVLAEKILHQTGVYLVLHGSSGLSGESIRQCIQAGITHLRFGTDLHQAFFDSIHSEEKEFIKSGCNPQFIIPSVIGSMKEVIKEKLEQLGSIGKAN